MSNGMAAFPGWHRSQARPTARFEAIERFNLTAWWEGFLPAATRPTAWPGVIAAVLGDDRDAVTVVLHQTLVDGRHAYGHAAAGSFDAACRKAAVELARHERVIQGYFQRESSDREVATHAPPDLLERRSLFFATAEGHAEFLRRLGLGPAGGRPARAMASSR